MWLDQVEMATENKDLSSDIPDEEAAEGATESTHESEPPASADDDATDAEDGGESTPRRRRKRKDKAGEADASPASKKSSSKKKRKKSDEAHADEARDDAADSSQRKRSRIVAAIVAVVIVLLVVAIIATGRRGNKPSAGPVQSDWAVGKEVPVDITLVAADKANLACASTQAIKGKHCAFEAPTKKWSKGGGTDDASVLRPYTTLDRRNLLLAGLWSDKALSGTLPRERFSVKCTFVIEGQLKKPHVRWEANGQWLPNDADWFAGSVKGCSLVGAKK
jgi:hypothetical protein